MSDHSRTEPALASAASNGADEVTYYTMTESEFFLGTVMLLNSLRVTGNEGKLVVLDVGLEPKQRALLERHADVVDVPKKIAGNPVSMKPYPYLLGATGPV